MAARKNRATSAPAHGSTSDLGSTSAKKSGFMTRLIFVVAAIVLILCLVALALFGLQYCVQQKAYDDLESYADTSTLNLADLKVDGKGFPLLILIFVHGFMFLVQRLIILLYTEQTMRYTSINRLMVVKDFSRVQELFSLMPTTIPICLIATMRSMVIT